MPFDSHPDAGEVLAEATAYRAHFDRSWFERLDSVDQELAGIAEDFLDRDLVETVDEESAFANAIAIV